MVLTVLDKASVQDQYEAYPYPEPIDDLKSFIKSGQFVHSDPSIDPYNIWPEGHRKRLNILVAGCGTFEAAYFAYKNPKCHVTGIDISQTSLEETRRLKKKHDLKNLRVKQLSLFDVAQFEETFDYIASDGVLHHLPDPVAGARALKEVLSPDGVFHVMLYGTTLRTGVYMLQTVFQTMGLKPCPEDIKIARETIKHLPEDHAALRYITQSEELKSDAAFVDTFLHTQDRAYSVEDIYQFADQAGFQFQDWTDRARYRVRSMIKPTHPLRALSLALNEKDQAIALDNLTQSNGKHMFFLRHKEADPKTFQRRFDDERFWTLIPHISQFFAAREEVVNGKLLKICYHISAKAPISPAADLFLGVIDGKRSIRDCLNELINRGAKATDETEEMTRTTFHEIYDRGYIQLQIPN